MKRLGSSSGLRTLAQNTFLLFRSSGKESWILAKDDTSLADSDFKSCFREMGYPEQITSSSPYILLHNLSSESGAQIDPVPEASGK